MPYTNKVTEETAIVATITPASNSAATYLTGAVDMSLYRRVVFVFHGGAISGGATVDFKLRSSATSGGTYADITGKAITQITSGSENIAQIEVTMADLAAGHRYVKGSLTIGTAAHVCGVKAYARIGRNKPESAGNVATVVQTVA